MTSRLIPVACLMLLVASAAAQERPSAPVPQLFVKSDRCLACHNGLLTPSGQDVSIGMDWEASIMAHSAQDPYWQASVRRETLDHPRSQAAIEDECAACHMPMARYLAHISGEKGMVFAHLAGGGGTRIDRLALEGVSCSLCHQIEQNKLGTEASYTGGFVVDTSKPPGERALFGPFEVDPGRQTVMRSAAEVVPTQGPHIQQSALCATCHTLYTHTRGPGGEVIGTLPEQVPYLEWLHSDYREVRSCQSCHLEVVEQPMPITSVLGEPREGFSKHVFRGGNFFMQRLLIRYGPELGVVTPPRQLAEAAAKTEAHLQTAAARLAITEGAIVQGRLEAQVVLTNLAGHKLPTAYPSRRVWIHFTIQDRRGRVVFESGALNGDGSIAGNDNDLNPVAYERHHTKIGDPADVQIYEAIMATPEGAVTTGLLSADRFIKDNRLLPHGFDKESVPEDIAVQGSARTDADFSGGGDVVRYSVPVDSAQGPFSLRARLLYQPIAFRWAHNLSQQKAAETTRFVGYYKALAPRTAVVLARDQHTVR